MQVPKASAGEPKNVFSIADQLTVLDKNCAGDPYNVRIREERLAQGFGPSLLRQAVVIDKEDHLAVGFPNPDISGITEASSRSRKMHISDPRNFTRCIGFFHHHEFRPTPGVAGRPD